MKTLTTTGPRAVTVPVTLRELYEDSTAPNTRRAYGIQLRAVDAFAAGRPLTDALVADFIRARFNAGVSPATLRLGVAAIGFRYEKLRGEASPVGPLSKRALAGAVRRGADRGRGQAQGIDFGAADAMAAVAGNGGKRMGGLRDAALLLVASDALLRASEVAALQVTDVETGDGKGKGAVVHVRKSKTDQAGEGASLFIRARTALAVKRWLEKAGITDGYLFRPVHTRGTIQPGGLSPRAVSRIIKRCAAAAGVGDGKAVSGHSLRVGAAGDLAMRGCSLPALCEAGRWKTPAQAAHYARQGLAQQSAVARLRPQ